MVSGTTKTLLMNFSAFGEHLRSGGASALAAARLDDYFAAKGTSRPARTLAGALARPRSNDDGLAE